MCNPPPSQLLRQWSKMRASLFYAGSTSGATFQCIKFLPLVFIFAYLSYLGHRLLLGLQTKTRKESNSSTFFSFKSHNLEIFMSSAMTIFVHAMRKCSEKCLMQKVACFGSPKWISMIQAPFCSS